MSKVIFIDDDADSRRQLLECCEKFRPDLTAKTAEAVSEVIGEKADFYVIDVSAVASCGWSLAGAYGPICQLMEEHPNAKVIVTSAMSRNSVEDLFEDIDAHIGRKPTYGGWGPWEDLNKHLA